jgi:phage gp36-like protein
VPGAVLGWVGDIARFRLWDQQAPEEVRRRYEDAIAQLKDVAAGRFALQIEVATAALPFEADGYSNTRVFTEDGLASF